jgi:hypothetical protein
MNVWCTGGIILRKTCPSATLSTDMGPNPGLRNKTSVTNRQSHGTASPFTWLHSADRGNFSLTALWTHSVSDIKKDNQLMYREIVSCSEIQTDHTNTLCMHCYTRRYTTGWLAVIKPIHASHENHRQGTPTAVTVKQLLACWGSNT